MSIWELESLLPKMCGFCWKSEQSTTQRTRGWIRRKIDGVSADVCSVCAKRLRMERLRLPLTLRETLIGEQVCREYLSLLGVTLITKPGRKVFRWHTSFNVGFHQQSKTVYLRGRYGEAKDPWSYLRDQDGETGTGMGKDPWIYFPHEATHCVWPLPRPYDPEGEWLCGMIQFELAWLKRLCSQHKGGGRVYARFHDYAITGRPDRVSLKESKKVVARRSLPDPWKLEPKELVG